MAAHRLQFGTEDQVPSGPAVIDEQATLSFALDEAGVVASRPQLKFASKRWRLAIAIFGGYVPADGAAFHISAPNSGSGQTVTFAGWYQFKLFLEHASGISMDALHILIGFLIFLAAARLMKRTIASPLPWLAVLAMELINEAYDLRVEVWPNRASQWGEGAKDILLTMAIPTLMLVLVRLKPTLLGIDARHSEAQSTTR